QGWILFAAIVRFLIAILSFLSILELSHFRPLSRKYPLNGGFELQFSVQHTIFYWNALNTALLLAAAVGRNAVCLQIYMILEIVFFGY
ncbi:hypothetical protein PFISCL1PPCAC_5315, partial [Pristionchus fissidentatus]